MRIGNTELVHGLMLAPMAGFTDYAMRLVARECGAEYTVTEMVSARAVVYGDKKTRSLARITSEEGAVALQIFGSEPSVMAEAAAMLIEERAGGAPAAAVDINMGCPVHKVFSNGDGSALMRRPELIRDITSAVSRNIAIPCTVKMRLGIDAEHINAVECALAAEEGGAAAICLHGRTRVQMYSGKADMERIAEVKRVLRIPLIANGDICTADDAVRALSQTGADGIAVGRGAIGNPFVFSEIAARLEGREYIPPTVEERAECALRQLSLSVSEKGEAVAVREARKQIALYFKAFRGAAELRAEINRAQAFAEVREALLRSVSAFNENR